MNSLEINVLQVLSTQSEDFLAKSTSSCFIAAGIEPANRVQEALTSLQGMEYVDRIDDVITATIAKIERDEQGNPILNEDDSPKFIFKVIPGSEDGTVPEHKELDTEERSYVADSGWTITEAGKEALANL